MSYEHTSLAGADAILAAGTSTAVGAYAGGGSVVDAGGTEAEGQLGAREHRPQRSLLVRLGQEVQEVPRRLSAAPRLLKPAPPLADDLIRLEPLEQRHALPLLAAVEGDDGHRQVHARPARPGRGVRPQLDSPLRERLGRRHERRIRGGRRGRRPARLRVAGPPGSVGARSRARLSRQPAGSRARGRHPRRRAPHPVVVRRRRPRTARAPDQPRQHRLGARRRARRLRPRGNSALQARPGRPPRRLRRLVTPRRGVGFSP